MPDKKEELCKDEKQWLQDICSKPRCMTTYTHQSRHGNSSRNRVSLAMFVSSCKKIGCPGMAYWASIDPEGPAVNVSGLCALRVHQKCSSSKVANEHAFPRCQQGT